jgi:hypothetical protein
MSKRTPGLERRDRDNYPTPEKAVLALVPHLPVGATFYAPCAGEGHLIRALERYGSVTCVGSSDIAGAPPRNARELTDSDINGAEMFIENPPWAARLLHPIIDNLVPLRPTWLLLYSDWLFTRQAVPYQPWVTQIVTMPRVIWIEGSDTTGFENCCWIRFEVGASDFMVSGWG